MIQPHSSYFASRGTRLLKAMGVAAFVLLLPLGQAQSAPEEDFNVLDKVPGYSPGGKILPDLAREGALSQLGRREETVNQLSSRKDVEERSLYTRQRLLRAVGVFPEKSPLNARTTGVLEREGYQVEKIIFESRPRLYVTANLYLPGSGTPPFPGILMPLGHELGSKANESWQHLAVNFARNGFVVLTYDPLGQGERVQLYDSAFGASKVLHSVTEHTLAGVQCLLLGHCFLNHRLWDSIRALDYLVTRPEVDPERIGLTGNSGGGTMTAHLAAIDDRIKVAVPSCYITSWRNLLLTIGPQDAEQSTPPFLGDGLDHADLITAFAPKPYMIASAIRDFFPIEGARNAFREAKRAYSLLESPENVDMVEADDGHGFTLPRRLAAYRWMSRWLKESVAPVEELPFVLELEEDLNCTGSGQVSTSLDARSIFSFHVEEVERLERTRLESHRGADLAAYQESTRKVVGELIGYSPPVESAVPQSAGQIGRPGYRIERIVFDSAPGVPVPGLLFIPDRDEPAPGILYLHGAGKAAEAGAGEEIESLVREGAIVLAIDMLGVGETDEEEPDDRRSDFYTYFGDYDDAMTLLMSGRTLLGLRVRDVVAAVDVLSSRSDVAPKQISAVGKGSGALVLLHAATLDPRFRTVVLEEMLVSYSSVIEEKVHWQIFEDVVPAALEYYDLPDLVAALAPRRVQILNAVDPRGNRLTAETASAHFKQMREFFEQADSGESLTIGVRRTGTSLAETCPELLGSPR